MVPLFHHAMMKHEMSTKPMPIGGGNGGSLSATTSPAVKRSLWGNSSRSPYESSTPPTPRSPITKAFDFLPWSRSKKSATTTTALNGKITNNAMKGSSGHKTLDGDQKKDSSIHYERNIVRNGDGVIRDILNDKLNKDKQAALASLDNSSPYGQKKCQQRKPKQIISRNKSLDINELIDCVENELAMEKQKNGSKRFLDDTFIENIMRAKDAYQRSRQQAFEDEERNYSENNFGYIDDGADDVDDDDDGDDGVFFANEGHQQQQHNTNQTQHPHPKHILFNDENTVYLIKKELPVKREMSKTKEYSNVGVCSPKHSLTKSPTASHDKSKHERSMSVLRARLKFKKLTPENSPQPEQKSKEPITKSVIDSCAAIGLAGIGLSLNNNNLNATNNKNSNNNNGSTKRGILHRQNTSPALLNTQQQQPQLQPQPHHQQNLHHHSNLNASSPELSRRCHQLYQRSEQRSQMVRRKSLTDTSYETHSQLGNSSSSSSMGSAGGSSLVAERPKTDKPRKKLSFREPVVSDRNRRLSSPLHLDRISPTHSVIGVPTTAGATTAVQNCDDPNRLSPYAKNVSTSVGELATNVNGQQHGCNEDPESQAMRIVRTVGQAFEVCHKFNLHKNSLDNNDERSDVSSDLLDVEHISEQQLSDDDVAKKDQIVVTPDLKPPQRPNHLELTPHLNMNNRKSPILLTDDEKSPTTPTSPSREINKLKDQLEAQAMQTRQALAQLMLVREQLISETNARIEAQARTQQLLQQNRELLEHLASLGAYNEVQTAGLTSANIAMAPQSQLQMLLQATSNNNNLATINQQINNLGSINQQLTSLSHQLSGLNQQSQNLQNLQNINANLQQQKQQQQQQTLTPSTPSTSLHQPQLQLNVVSSAAAAGTPTSVGSCVAPRTASPFPSLNQLQNISNQLQNITLQNNQHQQDALSKDLFQVNQELLNRLQALNLGTSTSTAAALSALNGGGGAGGGGAPTPQNSFFFVNPMSCSPANNNNNASNYNFLSSANALGGGCGTSSGGGTLTPSPMGTLSRNSYRNSPINDLNDLAGLSIDQNLNSLDVEQLNKSFSQLSSAASNGNIAGSGSLAGSTSTRDNSRSSSTIETTPSTPTSRNNNDHRFNTVMLKVTDEAGNVTNQRKLSATPSFITRSTSEKVPNRSQMMSQVQRTAWARHTTK